MSIAATDERGRGVCIHVQDAVGQTDVYDVVVAIDPENPLRCTCPECHMVYETPHAIALRILWEAMIDMADGCHLYTRAAQAIERIQGAEASKEL